jgi:DNA-directed RNA polymerase subunit M/transcription elongation factor TFIIS
MKLCIDCRHLLPKPGDDDYALAKCAAFYNIHPVSGRKLYSYAYNQRAFEAGKCGEGAIFWERKQEETQDE